MNYNYIALSPNSRYHLTPSSRMIRSVAVAQACPQGCLPRHVVKPVLQCVFEMFALFHEIANIYDGWVHAPPAKRYEHDLHLLQAGDLVASLNIEGLDAVKFNVDGKPYKERVSHLANQLDRFIKDAKGPLCRINSQTNLFVGYYDPSELIS